MKSISIIVLLVVIGSAWFFLNDSTNESTSTPQEHGTNEARVVPPLSTTPTDDTANLPQEEPEAAVTDMPGGNDVGMEFPEPTDDMTTPDSSTAETRVFDLVGTNFTFDVTEIRVTEGDTVTINFTSGSGFHDWVIDAFGAQTDRVRDGETASVTFVADTAGTYEYYCSVGSHRAQGMVGTLIVE